MALHAAMKHRWAANVCPSLIGMVAWYRKKLYQEWLDALPDDVKEEYIRERRESIAKAEEALKFMFGIQLSI